MHIPSPHLSPVELTDYAAHRLPPADVLRCSDHLAGCAPCRSVLARMRLPTDRQSGAFLSEPAGGLPDFDDLAGELDGTLTPSRHDELAAELARSPEAREALADLAAFRDELANLPTKHHAAGDPLKGSPMTGQDCKLIVPPRWRWRTTVARVTSLAALFVAVAGGSWIWSRQSQRADLLRDANGKTAELAGLPAALREPVETAARTGQLPPMKSALANRRETMAGPVAGARLAAVSPVGSVVREQRPTLRWTPREGATGYVVSCASTNGGSLLTSPLLPAGQTEWSLPETLPRGAVYQWQVEAMRGEEVIDRAPKPPTGEARFQILDAAGNDELEKIEDLDQGYPLILGVAYWRAGLTAAAEDQFHRLARTHTGSAVARRLEREVIADTASKPANPEAAP